MESNQLFLKVKRNMKYLYALVDDQTRFWIAQEVADTKYKADLRPLFQLGKAVARKLPDIHYRWRSQFHESYEQEFWTSRRETRTEPIREISSDRVRHSNMMERMNGELRDRGGLLEH